MWSRESKRVLQSRSKVAHLVVVADDNQPGWLVRRHLSQVADPDCASVALAIRLDPRRHLVHVYEVAVVGDDLALPVVKGVKRVQCHRFGQRPVPEHASRRRIDDVSSLERDDGRRQP